jgi:4-amino-4-deoxy-L-arabinose transferase-like glycosyltransferase
MNTQINPFHYLWICLAGLLLFLPGLGSVNLLDWDEINFAESAREMLASGNYTQVQVNFHAFWEKPPLFIWMQVLSMKMFGVNEFAARFPNVVFGLLTLCLIYKMGRTIFKGHIAHWWVLGYLGAITPHFYFKTGLIDPVFNFFIFLSIFEFYKVNLMSSSSYNANRHFLMAGIYTGIAILCKGPVALLVGLLVLFSMVFAKRMTWFFNTGNLIIYIFFTGLVSSIWFIPESIRNGPYFIVEFINYQLELFSQDVAGHEQPFYYHPVVLLIGCFPVSLIAMAGWKKNEFYTYQENLFRSTMKCLFWVVLILFSIVRTKIVHYSSLCWLPLTFMGAYAMESINHGIFRFRWYYKAAIIVLGLLIAAAFIIFPVWMIYYRPWFTGMLGDEFSRQNFLAPVKWNLADLVPGILLFLVILIFIYSLWLRKPVITFGSLLLGNMVVIFIASRLFVPKIEQHTQGAAIGFFRSQSNGNSYVFHTGYKSYAPYFYGKVKPLKPSDGLFKVNKSYFGQKKVSSYLQLNEKERAELDDLQKEWLVRGDVDREAFFIAKSNDREGLDTCSTLTMLWDRNGFVVYKRKPGSGN